MRVEEPEIAILAQCRVACENSIDRMGITEPSSQTSVLIHTLLTSYLQSCLVLEQKQGEKQKNVLPPLPSRVGKGSKDKRMEMSRDEKDRNRWQENSRVCKCCLYDLSVGWLSCFMLKQITVFLGGKLKNGRSHLAHILTLQAVWICLLYPSYCCYELSELRTQKD